LEGAVVTVLVDCHAGLLARIVEVVVVVKVNASENSVTVSVGIRYSSNAVSVAVDGASRHLISCAATFLEMNYEWITAAY
jgi:hypothetical protein